MTDASRLGDHLDAFKDELGALREQPVEQEIQRAYAAAANAQRQHEFYSEINLCRFPFAYLYDKDTGRTDKNAFIEVHKTAWGGTDKFHWIVTPDAQQGMPGPFDRKVFRAIEKIVYGRTLAQGSDLTNPQPISPVWILNSLRMKVGGTGVEATCRALDRLSTFNIECKGIEAPTPEQRRHRRRGRRAKGLRWRPLANLLWAGETHEETGAVYDHTMIWFDNFYLKSFNNANIRPIDWDVWLALKRPIAQRLYEMLEIKFYGLRHSEYVAFNFLELCQLLPMTAQKYRSWSQKTLDRAHKDMKELRVPRSKGRDESVRILDHVTWDWDGDDALIKYYPGKAYFEQLKQRRSLQNRQYPTLETDAFELARVLGDPKSVSFYQWLYGRVDRELIQIARTETLCARREGRIRKRPAAYFIAALTGEHRKRGLSVPYRSRATAGSK